ncbi:MAG TPA: hypothetical protein VH143_33660 [Kofleriaceae bacterium]|jgi:hypothetical protein|nr:hypothetical protein [Kofleriaceae bacterium]
MKQSLVLGLLLASSVATADSSKAWTAAKKLIPANMEMIGGVNAATAHNSALYQALLPMALAKAGDASSELDGIKADCGIDVVNSIDSLVFGLDASQQGTIVIAFRGVTRQQLEGCMVKRAKTHGKTLKVDTANGLTIYSGMNDKLLYTRWVGSDIVAISTQPDDKASTVAATAGGVASDRNLHGLQAVNTGASLWLVTNKTGDVPGDLGGGKMVGAYMSANVAGGTINLDAHVAVDTPATATAVATKSAQQLTALTSGQSPYTDLLRSVQVNAAANEVLVTARVPEQAVLGMTKMFLH